MANERDRDLPYISPSIEDLREATLLPARQQQYTQQRSTTPNMMTGVGAHPTSSIDKFESDTLSGQDSHRGGGGGTGDRNQGLGGGAPLPPLPPQARIAQGGLEGRGAIRSRTLDTLGRRSGIDWIVPVEEKVVNPSQRHTVGERLQPTLDMAFVEKEKYAIKAKMTGYALNAAIGLQVLLGTLTTGLSVVTTGRQTSIMTTILGGLATIVASYLARARGSNEPELSITRVKDLEQFIRECQAFQMDHGHVHGDEHNERLESFRHRFEELLGNANG